MLEFLLIVLLLLILWPLVVLAGVVVLRILLVAVPAVLIAVAVVYSIDAVKEHGLPPIFELAVVFVAIGAFGLLFKLVSPEDE